MKRTSLGIALVAVALPIGLMMQLASADEAPITSNSIEELKTPALVDRLSRQTEPAYVDAQGEFFVSTQLEAAWTDTTARALKLPARESYPDADKMNPAPEGEFALYEGTLLEGIAADYWRCSWIADNLKTTDAEKSLAGLREMDKEGLAAGGGFTEVTRSRDELLGGRITKGATTLEDYKYEYELVCVDMEFSK